MPSPDTPACAAYEAIAAQVGITVGAGSTIRLRDVQAFSYAGDNGASAGSRFGTVVIPAALSAAPEPSAWMLMLGGVGMLGGLLRLAQARRHEDEAQGAAAA